VSDLRPGADPDQEEFATRVRDKRRIDPVTGEVRQPTAAAAPAAPVQVPVAGPTDLDRKLAERTADLQRLKAEYDNYRRRVERDRTAVAEQALASVLVGLLPVLDDIERARAHGELDGVFRSVADNLETTLTKLGLTAYGDVGERFDPTVHEALMHSYSTEVTEPTCVEVLQAGYRLGERVLRPARVAVAEPDGSAPAEPDEAEATGDGAEQ
jgi:molecular chaperone GrpE